MTLAESRFADIKAWVATNDMCPASCLVVRDLIDEVDHLRGQVTRLLGDQSARRAQDDAAWQAHLDAMARLAGDDPSHQDTEDTR